MKKKIRYFLWILNILINFIFPRLHPSSQPSIPLFIIYYIPLTGLFIIDSNFLLLFNLFFKFVIFRI
jgi:hypothetical protein